MNREERENIRRKGQFWTPDWLARPMVWYVLGSGADHLLDPAVGTGVFFQAAKLVATEQSRNLRLSGVEIDTGALVQGLLEQKLCPEDLKHIVVGDFFKFASMSSWQAIVGNPPFIRHHRLSANQKRILRSTIAQHTGLILDGRAGLHVYFFVYALLLLAPGGRLSFILSSDVCEGCFANTLWRWVANHFAIDAVLTFTSTASPFPDVDINPIVVFISRNTPKKHISWAMCRSAGTRALEDWVRSSFERVVSTELDVLERSIKEALSVGLSRLPVRHEDLSLYTLADFAQVRRGIATGANDFFFMNSHRLKILHLPTEFTVRAIGRTRDVPGFEVTNQLLDHLDRSGRPTYLLSLDERSFDLLPKSIQDYIRLGEEMKLHKRPLIAQRNPWYKMERRDPPPILFAYLGRRNVRFILNSARVVPLTGFLCVYPKPGVNPHALWHVLNHPQVLSNLALVGKSYGDGAIKVEPRALERLSIPRLLCQEFGLPLQA
ncbi:MAG: SAM-dependent methyltransferase [Thermoflexales bacterium]|nr:SAM-dependent methyltransferase [Thermoflexales bacterium]